MTRTTDDPTALPAWLDNYGLNSPTYSEKDLSFFSSKGARHSEVRFYHKHLVLHVGHVPTQELIEHAMTLRPDAESMLRLWLETWHRAGIDAPRSAKSSTTDEHQSWVNQRLEIESDSLAGEQHQTAAQARFWYEHFQHVEGYRDRRLHIIDDAATFLSLRRALPRFTSIVIGNSPFELVGHDDDGAPRLKPSGVNNVRRYLQASDGRVIDGKAEQRKSVDNYWWFAPYLEGSKRRHAYSKGPHGAIATLAAMAKDGHKKAFVKGAKSKSGTWCIGLEGVETLKDVAARYHQALFPADTTQAVVIQEHLPFTHEQRFFVFDGRVVASVCSDRNFCAVDARTGHRLDDRVAVIKTPSAAEGSYDRGHTAWITDRSMSARFALVARKFAKEMRALGIREYVVDVGMTERGPAIIETNDFLKSGPYCLDRNLLVDAARVGIARLKAEVPAGLLAAGASYGMSPEEAQEMVSSLIAGAQDRNGVIALHDCIENISETIDAYSAEKWPDRLTDADFSLENVRPDAFLSGTVPPGLPSDCIPILRIPIRYHVRGKAKPGNSHDVLVLLPDGTPRVFALDLLDDNGNVLATADQRHPRGPYLTENHCLIDHVPYSVKVEYRPGDHALLATFSNPYEEGATAAPRKAFDRDPRNRVGRIVQQLTIPLPKEAAVRWRPLLPDRFGFGETHPGMLYEMLPEMMGREGT